MQAKNQYSEYNCWLQFHGKGRLDDALISKLSFLSCKETGLVAIQAITELQLGLDRMFGISCVLSDSLASSGILMGIQGSTPGFDRFHFVKNGSFVIQHSGEQIIIAGADDNGLLYGVFRLLMLLGMNRVTNDLDLLEQPCSEMRMVNHWDNLDGSIERGYAGKSIFYKNGEIDYDPERLEDYARLLASTGINILSINNVNVRQTGSWLIAEPKLAQVARIASVFRRFGIRLLLSINYASPMILGGLDTADPLDTAVQEWWKERCRLVYQYLPDLYGFLVKADSEHEPGPFQYGRDHAEGANMLAKAIAPHNGVIIWRCFVYNCAQDWRDLTVDRARAAYDNFMPLDGRFDENVILQIKNGPYDFQVKEPVSPLFGALKNTRQILEFQVTQEYTGHQKDLCYLVPMWRDVLDFDTKYTDSSKISDMIGKGIEGITAVINIGNDFNWTGHTLAQANLYGYCRLTWDCRLSAEQIADEWTRLTFGSDEGTVAAVKKLQLGSYHTYQKYNAPFGICFMVEPGLHYGPNIDGYEYSRWGTYHRATHRTIGVDRSSTGTGYVSQYSAENEKLFDDPNTCPEDLLLFFHQIPYDFVMKNGNTLIQNIYNNHFEGVDEVEEMIRTWKSLKPFVDESVYHSVLERFGMQLENAVNWRDVLNSYLYRKTGIDDALGRTIY